MNEWIQYLYFVKKKLLNPKNYLKVMNNVLFVFLFLKNQTKHEPFVIEISEA